MIPGVASVWIKGGKNLRAILVSSNYIIRKLKVAFPGVGLCESVCRECLR